MMRETGFTSPRHDAFPVGLRVLVVDDDPTWLKILERMLKKCCYEVTTCGLAREALRLLRERKDGYDIVISDVNMPDMDGFKLLEHVGLEMDLPVIMMSVDGETSRVMKGVQHGACDYLLKPIGIKELRNIWQHVFRKKIHDGPDGYENAHIRSFLEQSDEGFFLGGEEVSFGKKRKEVEYRHDDRDSGDSSSTKKARVVWSVELHKKFVSAVNQIGYDKVGPKKILDLMNVPWLTRENVASHLQKYRLYLSRLPIEGEPKPSFGEPKHSDSPSKYVGVNFDHQASMKVQADEVLNNRCSSSGGNANPNPKPVDPEGTSSTPVPKPERPLSVDVPSRRKTKRVETGYKQSLLPFGSDVMNFNNFDSTQVPTQFTWTEVPTKLDKKPTISEDSSNQLLMTNQHPYIMNSGLYLTETDIKPPPENQSMNQTIPASPDDFLQAQAKNHMVMNHDFKLSVPPTVKVQDFSMRITENAEPVSRNMNWGTLSAFPAPLDEDTQLRWLQHDILSANLGLQNIDVTQHVDLGVVSEFPIYMQDAMRFENFEHCYDPAEYPLVDQGLFII